MAKRTIGVLKKRGDKLVRSFTSARTEVGSAGVCVHILAHPAATVTHFIDVVLSLL